MVDPPLYESLRNEKRMTRTKQALWSRRFYEKHKQQRLDENKNRKAAVKKWVTEYRCTHPCIQCGEADDACLDFHHRDPSKKELEIATAINHGWSVQHLALEIAKCDTLCSNCHRKFHRCQVQTQTHPVPQRLARD